ncbi:apolipoprotein N-acyltransferase [Nocardioides sp. B-3]|uniref:apolipoprotein N-acyltransferase n=1 Tax=Nocardioides sp. B-3 TaxID=2895565 RepID=UPI0021530C7C|nr:apolipoprotein N-acyltransferase [Nocardioides sp. B-3]UUZ59092.1 apolipoprotein N-acyltransferase [Nocardioides sp. B-3]
MLIRCVAALLGGVVLSAGFAPVGFAPAMPVGIAILVLCVRGRRLRAGALIGWLFGLAFFGGLLWWLRVVGPDAWGALTVVQSIYFAPLGMAIAAVTRLRGWPVWTAFARVSVETGRGARPFGGLTRGRLSFATADTAWAATLPWIGMTGASLLIALTGTFPARLLTTRLRRPVAAAPGAAALVAVTCVPSLAPYDLERGRTMTIAAVQADVPGDGTDVLAHYREITRAFSDTTVELAESGEPVDMVVWSENSTAVDPFTDVETRAEITQASDAIGVPILVGGMVNSSREKEVLNRGIVWQPEVGGGDRYTKRHPVPYGEYIPYRGSFIPDTYGQLALIPRDMAAGTSLEPLRIAGAGGGRRDLLRRLLRRCDPRPGRQWRTTDHRADEQRHVHQHRPDRPAVRDQPAAGDRDRALRRRRRHQRPLGDHRARRQCRRVGRPRTRSVVVGDVTLADELTPAVWLGPWPGRVIVGATIVSLAFILVTYRRKERQDSPDHNLNT